MSITKVLALAAALIVGGATCANAASIGANVGPVGAHVGVGLNGVNVGAGVGPVGARVGVGTGLGLPAASGFIAQPGLIAQPGFINNGMMTQAAVVSGGVTAVGPIVGGNSTGLTQLPQGTLLVSDSAATPNTAIILPGMVGMPSTADLGCAAKVAVIGPGPSVLSMLGNNPPFVATLPAGVYKSRSYARVVSHKRVAKKKCTTRKHSCHKRVIKRSCRHQEILK